MHPHRAPAYPQHARRPSNPTNAPMPIPQYLAAQSPRPAIQSQSPGTPSPATPGSSGSSSASSTGHLYQVLAIGPNGLNAVQTETARPIGIYRQDKRRHEAHAPASASADGEPRRFVCQDCGAAFLRPSELRVRPLALPASVALTRRRRTSIGTRARRRTSVRAVARTFRPRRTSRATCAPSTPTDWLSAAARRTRLPAPALARPLPRRHERLQCGDRGVEQPFFFTPFNFTQHFPRVTRSAARPPRSFAPHTRFLRDDNP